MIPWIAVFHWVAATVDRGAEHTDGHAGVGSLTRHSLHGRKYLGIGIGVTVQFRG